MSKKWAEMHKLTLALVLHLDSEVSFSLVSKL